MIVILKLTYFLVGLVSFFLMLFVQCSSLRTFICESFVLAPHYVVLFVARFLVKQ